jgi:hypothetical protein
MYMTIWIIVLENVHFPSALIASAGLILHSSSTASTDCDVLDVSLMNSSGGYVVVSLLSIY